MKFSAVFYKNVPAVAIETEKYAVTVLPGEGGKIASFRTVSDGWEYLWQAPGERYLHVGRYDSYVDGECSAADDMFPTIDPTIADSGSRAGLEYPDHGEVCRMAFSCSVQDGTLKLEAVSPSLGYRYVKVFSESDDGKINILYKIENLSDDPFSALWALHCMVRTGAGGRVITPFEDRSPAVIMFDGASEFGTEEDVVAVSREMLTSREGNDGANSFKFYYKSESPEGFLGYEYPDGRRFLMNYKPGEIPYTGIWMNNGGFKNSYCVGLEPCIIAYDTVYNAADRGQSFIISGHSSVSFGITMSAGF